MSYELHVVRTKDWTQAASAPITKQDVDALVAADPQLAWSETDFVETHDDGGAIVRHPLIVWRGLPSFWWQEDQILCSGPDNEQTAKLVEMARALKAYAVGDDGEMYPPEEHPEAVRQQSLWQLGLPLVYAFILGCLLLALVLVFL
jgi:hypothetical protein